MLLGFVCFFPAPNFFFSPQGNPLHNLSVLVPKCASCTHTNPPKAGKIFRPPGNREAAHNANFSEARTNIRAFLLKTDQHNELQQST
jgi:hypothetical protein